MADDVVQPVGERVHRTHGQFLAPSTAGADDPSDLDELTKAELLEMAEAQGVDVPSSATKAEVISALSGR